MSEARFGPPWLRVVSLVQDVPSFCIRSSSVAINTKTGSTNASIARLAESPSPWSFHNEHIAGSHIGFTDMRQLLDPAIGP